MEDVNSMLVLPCSVTDEGTQKCHLGPNAFQRLQLKLGQCLSVTSKQRTFICKAWLRKDKQDGYIDFDKCVYYSPETSNANTAPNRICIKDIVPRTMSHVKSVEVEVVTNSCETVNFFRNQSAAVKDIVFQHMDGKVFDTDSIIECDSKEASVVHYIRILGTIPERTCGFVTNSSNITVKTVISKERFEACQNPLPLLGGLSQELDQLKRMIDVPLLQSELMKNMGSSCPKSVLLRGPPGCGKTTLAKRVACECKAVLVPVNGPDVVGSRPGETEENIKRLFRKAQAHSQEGPTVMLFDELDSFCGTKNTDRRVLTQLANILDQIEEVDNLVVIGSTNRPAAIDPSLRRPGRFDREVFIGIPSLQQKHDILKVLTKNLPMSESVDLQWLAGATPGFVGADLKALLQQAFYAALERARNSGSPMCITNEDLNNALHVTVPSSQRGSDVLVDTKPVRWEDIGGLETVKAQVKQAIELPLTHPEAFARLGLPRPKGVLLYGPPGCAKTTLVRAAATSCHVTFLSVSGAQLYSPFVGDSEKKIAEVFQQARAGAPCILFIDEIDSVVGSRSMESAKQGGVQERVLSTLLNEMDGIGLKVDTLQRSEKELVAEGETTKREDTETVSISNNDVLVVAATNRPDMLDDALLRPGRIDKIIYVPTPDLMAREEILKVHTRKMIKEGSTDLRSIAEKTESFSGADLENLCREAALHALSTDGLEVKEVQQEHFTHVLKTLTPTLNAEQLKKYQCLKFR